MNEVGVVQCLLRQTLICKSRFPSSTCTVQNLHQVVDKAFIGANRIYGQRSFRSNPFRPRDALSLRYARRHETAPNSRCSLVRLQERLLTQTPSTYNASSASERQAITSGLGFKRQRNAMSPRGTQRNRSSSLKENSTNFARSTSIHQRLTK